MPGQITPDAADLAWVVELRSESIWVIFGRRIQSDTGLASARRFLELLGEETAHVVFDARAVIAYSSGARQAWQRALWPRRHQIKSLSVVSHSQLTRMGATMFGAFLGVECNVVKAPGELPRRLRD